MTRAKKKPAPKRKIKEDNLTPIAYRAQAALDEKWPDDAECMGAEVLDLIAMVRSLRRQLKTVRGRTAKLLQLSTETSDLAHRVLPMLAARIAVLEERAQPGER